VRLIERLREARGLALHALEPTERPPGAPDAVELATGLTEGERPVALAASSRDRGDLAGWGLVAAARAGGERERREICLVAPVFTSQTRRSAARLAEAGARIRLVAVPGLASGEDEVYSEERHPSSASGSHASGPGVALSDRLLRVLDGAAALSGSSELRSVPGGFVLYVRGRLAMRIRQSGEGISLAVLAPEKREVHVTEAGFPRWAVELHELVVGFARDPRLLADGGAQRERLAEGAASQAGVRISTRWLPRTEEASDPVDWVALDPELRPVLGVVSRSVGLAEVPGLVAALHRFEDERELWAPGSVGSPRILLVTDSLDAQARALLQSIEVDVSVAGQAEAAEEASEAERARFESPGAPERRGRRRTRRRRRGRDEPREAGDEDREVEADAPERAEPERESQRATAERESQRATAERESQRATAERADEVPVESETVEREPVEREPIEREARRERAARFAPVPLSAFPGEEEPDRADEPQAEESEPSAARADRQGEELGAALLEPAEPDGERRATESESDAADSREGDEAAPADPVDAEIEATLAEEPEAAVTASPIEAPVVRRRNSRAAFVVCDDPDCVLAALVLARERRSVVSFVVCPQDGLMDYFRTRATDIGDNVDLLLVGFNAQPIPNEVISTAGLYRGRIEWFDHHDWPIEDLEMLREAIGAEAIQIVEGAASPLAAVMEISERRSRFTDKLIDLSGRRLGQGDMEKWGFRLAGLLEHAARTPGDHRAAIVPILAGKPAELPELEGVYAAEQAWIDSQDPRLVYFGEYQMIVVHVPENLDAGEVARRLRVKTGARLSMATRAGDDLIQIACSEEKRHVNVVGVAEQLGGRIPWAESRPAGDRTGRLQIQDLARHPERAEIVLSEVVRHKSVLYG
jgi:hypothetical protein